MSLIGGARQTTEMEEAIVVEHDGPISRAIAQVEADALAELTPDPARLAVLRRRRRQRQEEQHVAEQMMREAVRCFDAAERGIDRGMPVEQVRALIDAGERLHARAVSVQSQHGREFVKE